jgi:hypothetical protein
MYPELLTTTSAVALFPSLATLTVTDPGDSAVTTPACETERIEASEVLHTIERPSSTVPELSFTITVY